MTAHDAQQHTDKGAVLALVLAFLLPPVGLLLGIYGKREGRMSDLRAGAVVVGLIGTVLGTLLLITVLGNAAAPSSSG